MKRTIWLLPLALALSACGPVQPLGYCAADGLFYYTLGNPRNLRSATPAEVQAQGFDPYGYGSWCPGGAPTPTPSDTAEPATATSTPTNTAEPPTPTATSTDEPTATVEPSSPTPTATWPAPTPTSEPPERKPRVRIEKAYLLVNEIDGRWCVLLSDTFPGRQAQSWRCFPEFMELGDEREPWVATGAPCAGPIYDNDVWECDDESLEWRQARWPDAPWLHGLGRDSLEALCSRYPDHCDG